MNKERKESRSEFVANRQIKLTLVGDDVSNGLDEYCSLNAKQVRQKHAARWFVNTRTMRNI